MGGNRVKTDHGIQSEVYEWVRGFYRPQSVYIIITFFAANFITIYIHFIIS